MLWFWIVVAAVLGLFCRGAIRALPYRVVTLKRDGDKTAIWRAKDLWLHFDPSRDRVIKIAFVHRFSTASNEADALVVAEVAGRRVRLQIAYANNPELIAHE